MRRDDLDDLIDTAAAELRRPPETPRDRMWARIEADRRERRGARVIEGPWARFRRSRLWWPTAAAALILLGIGLGRLTLDEAPVVVEGPGTAPATDESRPLDPATVQVLDRAEILLAGFRAGVPEGAEGPAASDAPLAGWARGLLVDTRILLDSQVSEDPRLRELLADLEYTLAQIARLQGPVRESDRDWIAAGLARRATLERLRTYAEDGVARSSL